MSMKIKVKFNNLTKISQNIIKPKDKWMLAEDIPDIDFQFSEIWLSSFVNDLENTVGKNYEKILCVYKGFNLKFYYGEKDSYDFAEHILKLIIKRPEFGRKINYEIRKNSDVLKKECTKISAEFLSKLPDKELSDYYIKIDKIHTELYTWGWLPNAVDMFHNNFTDYLKSILKKKLPEDKINPALVALSVSPEKSILQLEHESFLNLVVMAQNVLMKSEEFKKIINPPTPPLYKGGKMGVAINKHLNKYFYLKHLWLGREGVYDFKYYEREIKKYIALANDARPTIKKDAKIFKDSLRQREKVIEELNLSKKEIALFNIYADFAVTKVYRRDTQLYWAYKMDFIFEELRKRLRLPVNLIRFMFPSEIVNALLKRTNARGLKKELAERFKFSVYYAEKGVNLIFKGKAANKIAGSIGEETCGEIKELSGQTACLGFARGKVRIINSIKEMKKMRKGDILVSIATNPDIVPAMKMAAAIITEQGGITSHAAIVSRELGTPCIIGTKIATKVLRDGDLVEVDANKGVVKILGKKE